MIGLLTRKQINLCKMQFVLLLENAPVMDWNTVCELNLLRPAPRDKLWRLAGAYIVHVLNVCVVLSFFELTILLLGTSDGPVNTLLNSLALLFTLELDTLIDIDIVNHGLLFDWKTNDDILRGSRELSQTPVGEGSRTQPRVLSMALRKQRSTIWIEKLIRQAHFKPSWHARFVGLSHRVIDRVGVALYFSIMLALTVRMQSHTTNAKLITFDDESPFGPHHPYVTSLFIYTRYTILFVLFVECHLAGLVTRDRKRPTGAPPAAESRVEDAGDESTQEVSIEKTVVTSSEHSYDAGDRVDRGAGDQDERMYSKLYNENMLSSMLSRLASGGCDLGYISFFFVDLATTLVFYIVIIEWVLGDLLPYQNSYNTDRLSFWATLSPIPRRPNDQHPFAIPDDE